MKRFLVAVIIIAVVFPTFLGVMLWFTYTQTDEETIPFTDLTVLESTVSPTGYEWHTPVFGGMMYKDFYATSPPEAVHLGQLGEPSLALEAPVGFSSTAVLSRDGQDLWSGSAADISEYIFLESGDYEVRVDSRRELEVGRGYGSFQYRFSFSAQVDVRLEVSAEEIAQGDILAIQFYNLPADAHPTASTWLGPLTFASNGEGRMAAYFASSHDTAPGPYTIQVEVDGLSWNVPFTIVETAFPEQELTIDTGNEEISEANSAAAYQEYNDTIPPLFEVADETIYWHGLFIQPTEGELTTEYGLFRYTNGSATASRHPALDISAARGEPVIAPNAGRILFAEKLLNTGNTIVIEHGDGLKSLFYHMDSLEVATGDMVEKGQLLGTVGSTGYSTGPHLHYEVRLYEMSVDPMRLFDGTCGIYAFEDRDALLEEVQQSAEAPPAETPAEPAPPEETAEEPESVAESAA